MSKKTRITRYFVIVESREELKHQKDDCERIATAIKRHVDRHGYAGVEAETRQECEHCGYNWTEKSDTFNGGCCDADLDAEDAANKPTIVEPCANADEMNRIHGDRYGVDWSYPASAQP